MSDSTGPKDVRLTPTEFRLLPYVIKYAGKVLTHQQILKEVWAQRTLGTFNTSVSTPTAPAEAGGRIRAASLSGH